MVSATPPSYLFCSPMSTRNGTRCCEGIWVRWRDGTRAFVHCSSDVQLKPLAVYSKLSPRHPRPAESTRLFTLVHLVSYVARLVRARVLSCCPCFERPCRECGDVGCLVDCPECRFGDSHSPAGLAELTYLAWVCCSYYVTVIAIFLYPRTHLTLLSTPIHRDPSSA